MRFSLAAASLVLLATVAGCGGSNPSSTSEPEPTPSVSQTSTTASTPTPLPPLKFEVKGACTSAGGTLYGVGSGFTPNGTYLTEVTAPNGKPYNVPDPEGKASSEGTTPNWAWPCVYQGKADPPGTYKVKIVDRETDRSVTTTFVVGKP